MRFVALILSVVFAVLLSGCGTTMDKVTDKAKGAKNRAELEQKLGAPIKSESATLNGKTVQTLTFKADDGEVTYTLEDDKIISVGTVEKKKGDPNASGASGDGSQQK